MTRKTGLLGDFDDTGIEATPWGDFTEGTGKEATATSDSGLSSREVAAGIGGLVTTLAALEGRRQTALAAGRTAEAAAINLEISKASERKAALEKLKATQDDTIYGIPKPVVYVGGTVAVVGIAWKLGWLKKLFK